MQLSLLSYVYSKKLQIVATFALSALAFTTNLHVYTCRIVTRFFNVSHSHKTLIYDIPIPLIPRYYTNNYSIIVAAHDDVYYFPEAEKNKLFLRISCS